METKRHKQTRKNITVVYFSLFVCVCLSFCGCSGLKSYSNEGLYPEDVGSVYVEMFDNRSFYRGVEYELTDALAKRIEVQTPYKIVSDRNRADTVLSGQIVDIDESMLSAELETGRALEKQVDVQAVVNWKNLKTGELLIDHLSVSASASYSPWQNQGFRYGSTLAANKAAERVVELMEKQW